MCHTRAGWGKGPDEANRCPGAGSSRGTTRFEAGGVCFEIGFKPILSALEVCAEGQLNSANAQEIARQIGAFASSHGCLRVLCDYSRTRIADSILGLYDNPARMEKSGLPRTLKIAVFYRRDEQKHRFWETVFRNRGYMLRAFRDRNDAVRWLLDRYRY